MTATFPSFLITIDTEGDDLWSRPSEIHTRNAAFVARFQSLCEEFGFKPTWLTNYEMAVSPTFQRFAQDMLRRRTGEIGMHLHAWNSPPDTPLTEDDFKYQPFLIEYPADAMEEKISFLTSLLRDRFETEIVSHRAGRWAFNSTYARLLVKYGYLVDCSVTPTVSWAETLGSPHGRGGTDYSRFPANPYFLDLDRIDRAGDSPLLELPVTVMHSKLHRLAPWSYAIRGLRRFAYRYRPKQMWLYPAESSLEHMLEVVEMAVAERRPYVEFVIHSSELMPGGRDMFNDDAAIDSLYADLRTLFREIAKSFTGSTLAEFRRNWIRRLEPASRAAMVGVA
jgi:hypothetical protein